MLLHTQKGIMLRAAYRTRKRREGVWFCGVCYEVMDVENISEREWEKMQQGKRVAPNCEICQGLTQRVPASVLTCPHCQQLIRASVFDGRVNKHFGPDGRPCTYRFRFRDGVAYNPGLSKWLQECVVCQKELEALHFNKTQLTRRREERRCKTCAEEARKEACQSDDKVRCKFYEDCECFVDISTETSMCKRNLRRGHTSRCCVLCQLQGRKPRDTEALMKCVAPIPNKTCNRLGRFQAKSRFPRQAKQNPE